MTQETVTLIAAVIAAVAAISAGFISWNVSNETLRKASQARLAEYRREWIENLRTNIAEYSSNRFQRYQHKSQYEAAKRAKDPETAKYHRNMMIECTGRQGQNHSYILLCLNPEEVEHANFEEVLRDTLNFDREKRKKYFEEDESTFEDYARRILKLEWDRLKKELAD